MFHPSVAVGHFPKISLEVPFTPLETVVESTVDRVISATFYVFRAIGELFHTLYRTITCSHRVVKSKCSTACYRVHLHKAAQVNQNQSPYVILALDGGGVRGKASIAALKLIEKELGTHLIRAVDCIAGVSTGGIIAAALSAPAVADPKNPRYTAEDVDDLYDRFAQQVFSSSILHKLSSLGGAIKAKYSSPKDVMRSVIGDVLLKDSIAKKLLITSLDLITGKLVYFESGSQEASQYLKTKKINCFSVSDDATIVDALEATSAAPTYFPTKEYKDYNLTDGGVADNNPAQLATLLAMNGEAKDRPILVISIGTGKTKKESITTTKSLGWGYLQWVAPLIDYFLDSKEEQADVEMNLLAASDPRINYVRFQMTLENEEEAQMDNASPENMKRLEELGTRCFQHFLDNGGRERVITPLKAKLQQLSKK